MGRGKQKMHRFMLKFMDDSSSKTIEIINLVWWGFCAIVKVVFVIFLEIKPTARNSLACLRNSNVDFSDGSSPIINDNFI